MSLEIFALEALAQQSIDVWFETWTVGDLLSSALGAFVTTLAVGAVMIAVAPDYTERMMDRVLDDTVSSLGYGLVCLVFVVLVTIVLVVTIIGILVAIPFAIASFVVWAIGSAIAFLAIGDRLVGHEEGWVRPLVLGAAINGLLTVSGIGALLSFGIGAAGFGAVLRDWLEDRE